MSQVTSSRGTRDRRSLADLEENASCRMGPGIAGHVRGLASVGQVARLRRSSDRSTMMTPVPLNHRFRTPIFSIRSVLVISLLRALIVTVIGLPVTSVRPGRTVASVRAAHSLGEHFPATHLPFHLPPVLANLPCFQPIFPAAISYRRCGNWVCDRLLALVHGCRCHCTQDCHKLGNEDVRSYIW